MLSLLETDVGERAMIRLITATLLLLTAAAPGFACEWNKSAAADTQSKATASHAATAQGGRS